MITRIGCWLQELITKVDEVMTTLNMWRAGSMAAFALCCVASAPVHAAQPASAVIEEADAALDLLLTREAQRLLDASQISKSRATNVKVSVRVDTLNNVMFIDFGPGFLPKEDDSSTEEVEQYISNTLEHYASRAGLEGVKVKILYEGRHFDYYFPSNRTSIPFGGVGRYTGGSVLLSAGHGLLRVHPGREWEFQRPAFHGVREDLVTSLYVDELQRLSEDRSLLTVHRARSTDAALHPESMQLWGQMSARYHVKALLPDRTDIWNHFADSNANDREVKDDIRTRPHYANHLGVDAMISIHTNAEDSQLARGTRVYYAPSKPADQRLAQMTLCYMKELITAQDGYSDFPVAASPSEASHGENRFADMPSVVVEVAFHTNATDAIALQDPLFREASMKGLEKGYRLFRQGKDCKPLKVEPIKAVTMKQGTTLEVDVPFEGFPQYPMKLITRNVGCPPGWTCTGTEVQVDGPQETPLKIALTCRNNGSAPLFWETSLVDDDGVTSKPVRHRQQCIRSS